MKKVPHIRVVSSSEHEGELFLQYLHSAEYPTHKKLLLGAFPKLAEDLQTNEDENLCVKNFIQKYYSEHAAKIEEILQETRKIIGEKGEKGLQYLGIIMEHEWKNELEYTVFLTILPFSPSQKNSFYFSILGKINNAPSFGILLVTTHEISHFLFFEKLGMLEKKNNFILHKDTKHFFKEALTAAVLNTEPLRALIGIKGFYMGNPEIQDLYIGWNNKEMPISYFIYSYFSITSGTFDEKLEALVMHVHAHENEFSAKREIWNALGNSPTPYAEMLTKYKVPIVLQ